MLWYTRMFFPVMKRFCRVLPMCVCAVSLLSASCGGGGGGGNGDESSESSESRSGASVSSWLPQGTVLRIVFDSITSMTENGETAPTPGYSREFPQGVILSVDSAGRGILAVGSERLACSFNFTRQDTAFSLTISTDGGMVQVLVGNGFIPSPSDTGATAYYWEYHYDKNGRRIDAVGSRVFLEKAE